MPQSSRGQIELFNDFFGVSNVLTLTADTAQLGDFYAGARASRTVTLGLQGRTPCLALSRLHLPTPTQTRASSEHTSDLTLP